MQSRFLTCATAVSLAAASMSAAACHDHTVGAPAPPVWPSTFNVTFTELTSDIITNNTFNGSWSYDWPNARQRIDRSTGKYDRYCGSVKTDDSPCTHLVVGGIRYLWWPNLEYCCQCCTDAQGCGVVMPTWMQLSNGTYVGRSSFSTPVWGPGMTDAWVIDGLQPNYWYQTLTGLPVELGMDPDDYQYYNPASFTAGSPQPDSQYIIPGYCSNKCPLLSICTFVAGKEAKRPLP